MPDPQRARLVAQGLVARPHNNPRGAVEALGAMQGQDLPGVIASAALRTRGGAVDDVLELMRSGELVRGYPMRGTVFLMAAVDMLWMSELCAAPAQRSAVNLWGQLGLDEGKVDRAREVAVGALNEAPEGLSRTEFLAQWEADGQPTAGGVGYHLLAYLMAEGTLCHGAWNGGDQNIALARMWLPPKSGLGDRFNGDRIAATSELLRRYLTGHGPATIRDFAWWTKLPLRDIRAALPDATDSLESDGADEASYWRPGLLEEVGDLGNRVLQPMLLPGFDEFILGYQDRTFAMTKDQEQLLVPGNNGVFRRSIVVGGTVKGFWRRGGGPGKRSLDMEPFGTIPKASEARLRKLFETFPVVAP